MRLSTNRLSLLLVLLVATSAARAPAQERTRPDPKAAGLAPEVLKKIDAMLSSSVEKKHIASGVALVARRGVVGHLAAVGSQDAEAGVPMRPDTIFRIASMTKPVTSVAAMILVDDGKLSLDDPISKFLPEFKGPRVHKAGQEPAPAGREITVRHLLTHTSGITYRFRGGPVGELYAKAGVCDGLSQTDDTLADNVRRIAAQPLLHEPGAAWEYGLNTDVLGRVVEVASGQSLDEFFRARIFEPLGLRDTHFFLPEGKERRLAALYEPGPDKTIRRVGDEPVTTGPLIFSSTYHYRGPRKLHSGGAGLASTASDYARFLHMLLDGGAFGGKRVLKEETVRAMTRDQIGDLKMAVGTHGSRFGYGFGVVMNKGETKDAPSVGTFSWGGAFYTSFFVDPERRLVGVLLTQIFPSAHLTLRQDFQRLALAAAE